MEIDYVIKTLLTENERVIIRVLDDLPSDTVLSIDTDDQDKIMNHLIGTPKEEHVWEKLLLLLNPGQVSDNVVEYLIKKKMLLTELCHMELSDHWLKELIPYDQMPLFTLTRRCYLSNDYSFDEFITLFNDYLCDHPETIIELLTNYPNALKRSLLIHLCKETQADSNKKIAFCLVADKIRSSRDPEEIQKDYENYSDEGYLMLEIAKNVYSNAHILNELSKAKNIQFASIIRRVSRETLAKKKKTQLR